MAYAPEGATGNMHEWMKVWKVKSFGLLDFKQIQIFSKIIYPKDL
jgi:hypothetical protein